MGLHRSAQRFDEAINAEGVTSRDGRGVDRFVPEVELACGGLALSRKLKICVTEHHVGQLVARLARIDQITGDGGVDLQRWSATRARLPIA